MTTRLMQMATLAAAALCATAQAAPPQADPRAATPATSPERVARKVDIVNTFNTDPAHLYDPNQGGAISGPDTGVAIAWAAAFTPIQTAFAKTVTLALGHWSGANIARVTLRADANGFPGAVIRKATLENLPRIGCCSTVSFSLKSKDAGLPMLEAGTRYWLHVESSKNGTDTDASWALNNIGATGRVARYYDGMLDAFDYRTFAFSVSGQ